MTSPTVERVLELAERRNIALARIGDQLTFRGPAKAVAELRPLLVKYKPALLAILSDTGANPKRAKRSGDEQWDESVAMQLIANVNALLRRLGVDRRHPSIVDTSAMLRSAFETRDLETVHFACSEFKVAVRKLANRIDCQK
jgi:hypothetical protein